MAERKTVKEKQAERAARGRRRAERPKTQADQLVARVRRLRERERKTLRAFSKLKLDDDVPGRGYMPPIWVLQQQAARQQQIDKLTRMSEGLAAARRALGVIRDAAGTTREGKKQPRMNDP